MSTALQQAIEALLIEQREREALIQRLIALNNGHATPNGHAEPPAATRPAGLPAIKGVQAGGPVARIYAYLQANDAALVSDFQRAGLTKGSIHGAVQTLMRTKLVTRTGKPKHYVYKLVQP